MIKEDPDHVKSGNLDFEDSDAIAFGYYQNKMRVSNRRYTTHDYIRLNYDELRSKNLSRTGYKFSGRAWTRKKVMSFWKYPKPNEMKKLFDDLKKEIKYKRDIDIGNIKDWSIEIKTDSKKRGPVDIVVPILQYIKQDTVNQRSDKDAGKAHILSPMVKGKSTVPKGIGSKKYPSGMSHTQYKQMHSTSENKIKSLRSMINEEIKYIMKTLGVL